MCVCGWGGGGLVYSPDGLWVLVGGGGGRGGATNLRLAPKAVSGAPGALRRQPARSPWMGGRMRRRHTHRFVHADARAR